MPGKVNSTGLSTEECIGMAGVPGFILGALLGALMVILFVHRKQIQRDIVSRLMKRTSTEGSELVVQMGKEHATIEKSDHYSEIDEKKTRTYAKKKPMTQTSVKGGAQGYEDCIVGDNKHRYSDIETDEGKQVKVTKEQKTNNYEPFSPGKQKKEDEKRISTPIYYILEPGSDKRLPVKMIENKSEMLQQDLGHVYFILEPGTNKVSPVNRNVIQDACNVSNGGMGKRDSGPIYFVLEPMTETNESEALPYAVNDVRVEHDYFILEKTEHV